MHPKSILGQEKTEKIQTIYCRKFALCAKEVQLNVFKKTDYFFKCTKDIFNRAEKIQYFQDLF